MQRALLGIVVATVVALVGALAGAAAWTGATTHRAPVDASASDVLDDRSRWLVDDPAQTLHLRAAELALAEGQVPVRDTLVPAVAPPLFPGLVARAAALLASEPGAAPATRGVTRAALEGTAVWVGVVSSGLAAALASLLALAATRRAGAVPAVAVAAVGGAAFALLAGLRPAAGERTGRAGARLFDALWLEFTALDLAGAGPVDPWRLGALLAVALVGATWGCIASRDATTVTLAALGAGLFAGLAALTDPGLLLLGGLCWAALGMHWWWADDARRRPAARALALSLAAAAVVLGPSALRGASAAQLGLVVWVPAAAAVGIALVLGGRLRGAWGAFWLLTVGGLLALLIVPSLLGALFTSGGATWARLQRALGPTAGLLTALGVGVALPVLWVRGCARLPGRAWGAAFGALGLIGLSTVVATGAVRAFERTERARAVEPRADRARRIELLRSLDERTPPTGRWDRARAAHEGWVFAPPELGVPVAYHGRRRVRFAWLGGAVIHGNPWDLRGMARFERGSELADRFGCQALVVDARLELDRSVQWLLSDSPWYRRLLEADERSPVDGAERVAEAPDGPSLWVFPARDADR